MSTCFRNDFVKTRKPHKCECCGTVFPAESDMWRYAGIFEGEFCSFYYCELCDDLYHILGWDWSEGIQDAEEALCDDAVMVYMDCPHGHINKECHESYLDYRFDFLQGQAHVTCEGGCTGQGAVRWDVDLRDVARKCRAWDDEQHARIEELRKQKERRAAGGGNHAREDG